MDASSRMARASTTARLDQRVLQVCDAAGAFIEYWGFKAILGRVWTLLALHREPMSQTELAHSLGVSRSLVCGAVDELARLGLVRPLGATRNAPYVAVLDVWPTISDVLRSREWMLLESARLALDAAIEEADLARAAGKPVAYEIGRMRLLLAMTDSAQALLRMLIAMRGARPLEAFGGWVTRATQLIQSFRATS